MKRFLTLIIGLVVLAGFSISIAANPPAKTVVDAQYVLDGANVFSVIKRDTIASPDSIMGSTDKDTIVRNFVPLAGREYILAFDSVSTSQAIGGATACRLILQGKSKIGGKVIGSKDFDTLKALHVPFQTVVPFNQTVLGMAFDIIMANTASSDTLLLRHVYLLPRHTYIANQTSGTGMFGN
jgi:hypothetical protein